MKHITKYREPEAFTQWKREANESWQPTYGGIPGVDMFFIMEDS